jgi:HSP20 family protein
MTIVRWIDPARELAGMQDRLNRIFEDFFRTPRGGEEGLTSGAWTPAVDIRETDDAVVVSADLPGIEKEMVSVEFKEGILTLRGERKFEREVKEENYHRLERTYGAFHRSFTVPAPVDEEKISAGMKDGVLEIRLPKKEAAKPRQIKVAA